MSCINENFLKSPLAEKHQKDLFYLLLICIITGSLYAPFMHFPFLPLWDDGRFVLYNSRLDFTWENIRWYFSNPFRIFIPL